MNDLDQKRDFVSGLYPGRGWKRRVAAMSDAQVLAIYMREINKAKERPQPSEPEKKESGEDGIPF